MVQPDERGDYWVHERDYGANPIGDFISGFFHLTCAVVIFVYTLFSRRGR